MIEIENTFEKASENYLTKRMERFISLEILLSKEEKIALMGKKNMI